MAETVNLLSYCYMIYPLVSWRHLICNEFIMVNLCILWSPSDCGRTLILSFFGQKIRFCMHVADKSPLKRKSSRAYLDFKRENGTNCKEYIRVYVFETRITSWWKPLYVGTEYGGHESFRINEEKKKNTTKKELLKRRTKVSTGLFDSLLYWEYETWHRQFKHQLCIRYAMTSKYIYVH